MPENKERKITIPKGGVFDDLATYIKLVLHLMGDKRVNPFLKLLPIGAAAYFIIPDIAIGPIDDVLVVWLGTYLFVELCPPDVVQEHREAIRSQAVLDEPRNPPQPPTSKDEEVIEGEFWEKKD
jgi:uncharacterized membrane protein YkvA (DUF1232 family)